MTLAAPRRLALLVAMRSYLLGVVAGLVLLAGCYTPTEPAPTGRGRLRESDAGVGASHVAAPDAGALSVDAGKGESVSSGPSRAGPADEARAAVCSSQQPFGSGDHAIDVVFERAKAACDVALADWVCGYLDVGFDAHGCVHSFEVLYSERRRLDEYSRCMVEALRMHCTPCATDVTRHFYVSCTIL